MTQEANGKELRTTIFGSVKRKGERTRTRKKKGKRKKKRRKKNQIEQLKKKFKPNEDQIIRQKSLESGKEQLKPNVSSELQTPHSNYMVNSKQMILLLNNLHCPCGRRKTLEELKENYGSFRAILNCKKCPIKQYKDNKETFNFSNKIEGMGKNNNNAVFRTEIGQRKIIASVLAGNFYENYREQMEMLGLYYLKKNAYYKTIDLLIRQTNILFQDHLKENRSKMDLNNLTICIDAGWSMKLTKKNNKAADRLNLNKKNDAFINLSKYITEFENTFKIKKKIRRTKTLNINAGEFNGDIEIFKEVGEVEDGNILETGNLQEEALYDENELEEIEEILTSHRKKNPDRTDDLVFGISFDKRLPTSFTDNTLLFEIERNNKNK
ncbi:hypothetical protein M0813_09831 [Anaeramoeba flamelloides]|uniref:Uncharacterized protein n=1 Tax=Anaeramoeba flamelloides TaxID=1746091 RepID=A0ABQ8X4A6_9EUKA|nr:hypothetical protein M0813_09831 [Anaeramoeba flamelloides]